MRAEEAIRRFNQTCRCLFMATVEADRPRLRPMSPVAVEGNVVYLAAFADSPKMAQVAANPNVELCYLDGEHNQLRLRGKVEVCNDPATRKRMWEGYPLMQRYFKSPEAPEYALLRVSVDEALLMETMSLEYRHLEV